MSFAGIELNINDTKTKVNLKVRYTQKGSIIISTPKGDIIDLLPDGEVEVITTPKVQYTKGS